MTRHEAADRIAACYPDRPLQEYARWKIRADPVYAGVTELLRGRSLPLFDVGCGVGLLALCLREAGIDVPIAAIDFDQRKIALARAASAAAGLRGVEITRADARHPFPGGHDVVLLDILQYFDAGDRAVLLANAARAVPPGGMVIIRTGIRDRSWRYRLTWLVDYAGWLLRWMRAGRLHFPTREEILSAFPGFAADVKPLYGRTPYNNWLFVFVNGRGVTLESRRMENAEGRSEK